MKKARRTSPKQLQISLSINPQDFGISFNPKSNPISQSHSKTSPKKQVKRYMTKGRTEENNQGSWCGRGREDGIIRLGSKKKNMRMESRDKEKENLQYSGLRSDTVSRKEASPMNSLNKYFESNRVMKSVQLNRVNVDTFQPEETKIQTRLKTELKNKTEQKEEQRKYDSRFDQITLKDPPIREPREQSTQKKDRRRMSQSKSMQNFFDRKKSRDGRSCSLNKQLPSASDPKHRLQKRLQKIKQYKFIQDYLSDFELEGIFNELQIANIPQVRWPLIIVDRVYQIIRRREANDFTGDFIRNF